MWRCLTWPKPQLGRALDVHLGAGRAGTFRHRVRHLLDVAVGRIIQNQNLRHFSLPLGLPLVSPLTRAAPGAAACRRLPWTSTIPSAADATAPEAGAGLPHLHRFIATGRRQGRVRNPRSPLSSRRPCR
jgi:hypothetical protein